MQHRQQPHDIVGGSIPRSSFYDSPFGRMFGRLEPWVPAGATDADKRATLRKFAEDEMVDEPGKFAENDDMPAGYTYFGQFVDHDITFDPTSSTTRQNDPNKVKNFRTPRFDLDSVYGAGPEASPYLYADSATNYGEFVFGTSQAISKMEHDLPRNMNGKALIGDPRNDENIIVSQLQLAFLKLHNLVLDQVKSQGLASDDRHAAFLRAQQSVRWLYQYVVWNDFVRRLAHDDLWSAALTKQVDSVGTKSTTTWEARKRFYRWKHAPYIPVEFSVAAYRFGHSMVRPGYQVSFKVGIGPTKELPIFSDPARPSDDLRGGRTLPAGHTVQWDWFFDINSGGGFPQKAGKIDPRLSSAMSAIPMGDGTTAPLAFLNLQRGWRMELPSGPAVADQLGIDPADRPAIKAGTPEESLWFYILKETATLGGMSGKMLGPVGGTIVADVFAGLLDGDPLSYINLQPLWTPDVDPALTPLTGGSPLRKDWEVADILRAAGVDTLPIEDPGPITFPS